MVKAILDGRNYIKWGFESRLKHWQGTYISQNNYIKWGFESRLKLRVFLL